MADFFLAFRIENRNIFLFICFALFIFLVSYIAIDNLMIYPLTFFSFALNISCYIDKQLVVDGQYKKYECLEIKKHRRSLYKKWLTTFNAKFCFILERRLLFSFEQLLFQWRTKTNIKYISMKIFFFVFNEFWVTTEIFDLQYFVIFRRFVILRIRCVKTSQSLILVHPSCFR